MWNCDWCRWVAAAFFATVLIVLSGRAVAQDSMSALLAVELGELMNSAQLDAVAAKDSEGTDRFVAALAFPGQLLVVSARYEVPIYVEEKIANRLYRGVYIDLNAASIANTKILVTDAGADGLAAGGSNAVDMYDAGSRVSRFDGDPDAQDLTREDYMKAFSDADVQYSRMLEVLLNEVR